MTEAVIISSILSLCFIGLYCIYKSKLSMIIGVGFIIDFTFMSYLNLSGEVNKIGNNFYIIILFKDFIICCFLYCYCKSIKGAVAILIYCSSQVMQILSFLEFYTNSSTIYNIYGDFMRCIELIEVLILVEMENVFTRCRDNINRIWLSFCSSYNYSICKDD